MFKNLRKPPDPDKIRFCDRCSSLCDDRRLADAVYEQSRGQWPPYGWRSA